MIKAFPAVPVLLLWLGTAWAQNGAPESPSLSPKWAAFGISAFLVLFIGFFAAVIWIVWRNEKKARAQQRTGHPSSTAGHIYSE